MSTATVLITGATGFVGSHITLLALEKGYKIRATARSQAKADAWTAKYPDSNGKIDWVLVRALEAPGAFDGLMDGVDYVIHTATPVATGFADNEKDMLIPAIEGVMSVMRAAAKQSTVKKVIITGSFGAVASVRVPGKVYGPDDWNETTYEEAAKSPPGTAFVYSASKAIAEKAAWDFMAKEEPHFTFTSLCVPIIYGPPAQVIDSMDTLPASCAEMWSIFSGQQQDYSGTLWPWWIDVRDVAKMHVDAVTNEKAANQRYLGCAGYQSYSQIAHIVATAYPEQAHRLAKSDNSPPPAHAILDPRKAEADFGIKWIGLEKCITDMAGVMYAREKELAGAK